MKSIGKLYAVGAILAVGLAGCTSSSPAKPAAEKPSVTSPGGQAAGIANSSKLEEQSQDPNQWVTPAGGYDSLRHSKLGEINTGNVSKLGAAWTWSMGTSRGLEGNPLVIGDMLYAVSSYPNYVYALKLDGDSAQLQWKFVLKSQADQPEVRNSDAVRTACCDLINRGPAYGQGKLFFQTLDGHLVALNAKTGKLVWSKKYLDAKIAQTSTASPLVVHNQVIAGMSGGEFGVRGFLSSFDIRTGKLNWRAYSNGPDKDMLVGPEFIKRHGANTGLKTWLAPAADEWKHGGSTPWSGLYSYDPKLNLLYYTTGNPGTWNPDARPGDNKWSNSVFARNPDTGEAVWAYQYAPHDLWDHDSTQETILTDMKINGQVTPVLTHFDKNGFSYVNDRRTGKLLAAHPYYEHENAIQRVDLKTGRMVVNPAKVTHTGVPVKNICPAAQGAKDNAPAAHDPKTGLFYIPTNNICMDYQAYKVDYQAGHDYVGAIVRMYRGPGGYGGAFMAFDPLTGKTSYSIKEKWPLWSGVLTTAGGVSFYGTLDGWFKAVDTRTGKQLWKFQMPSGVVGNPISFSSKGHQYIAIFAGVGGWPGASMNLVDPADALGASNYYVYGRCDGAGPKCVKPLNETVTVGGDLLAFRVR